VLIIEAMAQVGGILARLSVPDVLEREMGNSIFFVSMEGVKFRRPVIPGDRIRFELVPLRTGSRIWKMAGKASVEGEVAAEAILVATIG
ncbi:MAG TPA: 3-hydroxyacyl-[acyl-carrier-protein] dehydratase FabZ, partial [Desulfobacteraceae bacterium]|nr:3-hydroxyacyl-[acyl-carrier-protein] dehydratase FabZ [Desulfobacteraceae bacterium]